MQYSMLEAFYDAGTYANQYVQAACSQTDTLQTAVDNFRSAYVSLSQALAAVDSLTSATPIQRLTAYKNAFVDAGSGINVVNDKLNQLVGLHSNISQALVNMQNALQDCAEFKPYNNKIQDILQRAEQALSIAYALSNGANNLDGIETIRNRLITMLNIGNRSTSFSRISCMRGNYDKLLPQVTDLVQKLTAVRSDLAALCSQMQTTVVCQSGGSCSNSGTITVGNNICVTAPRSLDLLTCTTDDCFQKIAARNPKTTWQALKDCVTNAKGDKVATQKCYDTCVESCDSTANNGAGGYIAADQSKCNAAGPGPAPAPIPDNCPPPDTVYLKTDTLTYASLTNMFKQNVYRINNPGQVCPTTKMKYDADKNEYNIQTHPEIADWGIPNQICGSNSYLADWKAQKTNIPGSRCKAVGDFDITTHPQIVNYIPKQQCTSQMTQLQSQVGQLSKQYQGCQDAFRYQCSAGSITEGFANSPTLSNALASAGSQQANTSTLPASASSNSDAMQTAVTNAVQQQAVQQALDNAAATAIRAALPPGSQPSLAALQQAAMLTVQQQSVRDALQAAAQQSLQFALAAQSANSTNDPNLNSALSTSNSQQLQSVLAQPDVQSLIQQQVSQALAAALGPNQQIPNQALNSAVQTAVSQPSISRMLQNTAQNALSNANKSTQHQQRRHRNSSAMNSCLYPQNVKPRCTDRRCGTVSALPDPAQPYDIKNHVQFDTFIKDYTPNAQLPDSCKAAGYKAITDYTLPDLQNNAAFQQYASDSTQKYNTVTASAQQLQQQLQQAQSATATAQQQFQQQLAAAQDKLGLAQTQLTTQQKSCADQLTAAQQTAQQQYQQQIATAQKQYQDQITALQQATQQQTVNAQQATQQIQDLKTQLAAAQSSAAQQLAAAQQTAQTQCQAQIAQAQQQTSAASTQCQQQLVVAQQQLAAAQAQVQQLSAATPAKCPTIDDMDVTQSLDFKAKYMPKSACSSFTQYDITKHPDIKNYVLRSSIPDYDSQFAALQKNIADLTALEQQCQAQIQSSKAAQNSAQIDLAKYVRRNKVLPCDYSGYTKNSDIQQNIMTYLDKDGMKSACSQAGFGPVSRNGTANAVAAANSGACAAHFMPVDTSSSTNTTKESFVDMPASQPVAPAGCPTAFNAFDKFDVMRHKDYLYSDPTKGHMPKNICYQKFAAYGADGAPVPCAQAVNAAKASCKKLADYPISEHPDYENLIIKYGAVRDQCGKVVPPPACPCLKRNECGKLVYKPCPVCSKHGKRVKHKCDHPEHNNMDSELTTLKLRFNILLQRYKDLLDTVKQDKGNLPSYKEEVKSQNKQLQEMKQHIDTQEAQAPKCQSCMGPKTLTQSPAIRLPMEPTVTSDSHAIPSFVDERGSGVYSQVSSNKLAPLSSNTIYDGFRYSSSN